MSISGIVFNRHALGNPEAWELPNFEAVRRKGVALFGRVATARGAAKMYAAAFGSIDGAEPLLTGETIRKIVQIRSMGYDVVTRDHRAFTAGFHPTAEYFPSFGGGTFGHSGVGGRQTFADPRHETAFAHVRRWLAEQSVAVEDIGKLIDPLKAVEGR